MRKTRTGGAGRVRAVSSCICQQKAGQLGYRGAWMAYHVRHAPARTSGAVLHSVARRERIEDGRAELKEVR